MSAFERLQCTLDELREARIESELLASMAPPLPEVGAASLSEFVAALDARDEQTYPTTARQQQ